MQAQDRIAAALSSFRAPVLFAALCAAPCSAAYDSQCALAPAARIESILPAADPEPAVPGRIYGRNGLLGPRASGGFRSELEAAVAASSSFNPMSIRDDREYLGGILFDGREYYYTASRGYSGRGRITARIPVPGGHTLVAFWHTHGSAAAERQYFSEVDTGLVRDWDRPLYLSDYTGTLKVYAPGDDTLSAGDARRLGLPPRAGYAAGTVVRDAGGLALAIATRPARTWVVVTAMAHSAGGAP